MKRDVLTRLRAYIEKGATSLTDTDALDAVALFPAWAVGVEYEADTRIRYGEKLYKVVQAHTSQEDWLPEDTPALYTEVAKPGEIPVWKQPTGAQDAYMTGDKVHYPDEEGPVYVCTSDYNVYAPDVFGWELYAEEQTAEEG